MVLRAHAICRQEIEFSRKDGVERQKVRLREFVARHIQRMVGTRYRGEDMSEQILLAGLRTFARIKDEFDQHNLGS